MRVSQVESRTDQQFVRIPADSVTLEGILTLPQKAIGVVIFAHGSGSSRHSPRNNFVAEVLQGAGLGTLLFDLLTEEEDKIYENRFDIALLTNRLKAATLWLKRQSQLKNRPLGYFGASTGVAAALEAAAELGKIIKAIVSRGGRPDLAKEALIRVQTPTLLIVGGNDEGVIKLNKGAFELLKGEKELKIIPGASHLFEEPGTLEEVAKLATEWFRRYLL